MAHTYSPDQCLLTFDSQDVVGFADGSMIKIARNVEAWKYKVGGKGSVVRTKVLDETGRITVSLQPGSASNKRFSTLAALDKRTGLGKRPVYFIDLSTGTVAKGLEAWIEKLADTDHADESTNREWVIFVAQMDYVVG